LKYLLYIFCLLFSQYGFCQLVGKVISISDGDTFTLIDSAHHKYKIRLYGIDCPEYGQDFGQVARQFTSKKVFKKMVYVKKKDVDRYGRTVGVVYILPDSVILNEELLKAGLAWHYLYYDKNKKWTALEAEAKANEKGLWKHKGAIPPWEYRRHKVTGYKSY